jgi:hypothetical protein
MVDETTCRSRSLSDSNWIEGTNLFREWTQMKQEILLHKWYESEKAGHDIGWERASVDWMVNHCRHR